MKPESARTLVVASGISLALGLLVMSPSARFSLEVLSALFAAVPVYSGRRFLRIAAAFLLAASLLSAAVSFSSFQEEQRLYRERAIKPSR